MNSRAKQKLTRSWQDRDWNRNRRLWYRLPLPIGKPCWILLRTNDGWQVQEAVFSGFVHWGEHVVYYVSALDAESKPRTGLSVLPQELFDTPDAAEAERRSRT